MNLLSNLRRRLRKRLGYQWPIRPLIGGIKPPLLKEPALAHPIITAAIPTELVLPLQAYRSLDYTPVVTLGAHVMKGQVLATSDGLNLHAPSSGTITTIEKRPVAHPSGMLALSLVLTPDGKDTWHPHITSKARGDFKTQEPETLIELIREAGIAGLGGAGFPTDRKLTLAQRAGIETLIINAVECEPYIAADEALLQERADHVVAGIQILQHILKPAQCLVAIEDSKPKAIDQLLKALAGTSIEPVIIPTRYPSGSEKQLIRILTGKELAQGQLPAHIGIHCQNVGSAYAIYRAIVLGEPLISRICTVTGSATQQPRNIELRLGTSARDAIAMCANTPLGTGDTLVFGGPLMGIEAHDDLSPVMKTSNCLIASKAETFAIDTERDCIRCGFCAQACPAKLLPQHLLVASKMQQHDQAQALGLNDCIECGACSYVCPSKIPLVQYYRAEKSRLKEQNNKRTRAHYWQQRFEFHQERVSTEKATALDRRSRALRIRAKAPDHPISTDLHNEVTASLTSPAPVQGSLLTPEQAKSDIQAALQRAKAKKQKRQNLAANADKPAATKTNGDNA